MSGYAFRYNGMKTNMKNFRAFRTTVSELQNRPDNRPSISLAIVLGLGIGLIKSTKSWV